MYLVLQLFHLMKHDVNMGPWERKDSATGSFVRMSICCSSGMLRKDLKRGAGGGGNHQRQKLFKWSGIQAAVYVMEVCGTIRLKTKTNSDALWNVSPHPTAEASQMFRTANSTLDQVSHLSAVAQWIGRWEGPYIMIRIPEGAGAQTCLAGPSQLER